jgi:hypothetical protein
MGITKRDLEQAYVQHKAQSGGSKEDYFALLYLTREFDKSPDQVARHIAFGEDVAEGMYLRIADFTAARMTALSPGASRPSLLMPIP